MVSVYECFFDDNKPAHGRVIHYSSWVSVYEGGFGRSFEYNGEGVLWQETYRSKI